MTLFLPLYLVIRSGGITDKFVSRTDIRNFDGLTDLVYKLLK
jgi:hypothetical protein